MIANGRVPNGMSAKIAMASPRRSGPHKSAMIPPELVSGAAAKHPPRNRNTMSDPMFGESAQPTWKPAVALLEKIRT